MEGLGLGEDDGDEDDGGIRENIRAPTGIKKQRYHVRGWSRTQVHTWCISPARTIDKITPPRSPLIRHVPMPMSPVPGNKARQSAFTCDNLINSHEEFDQLTCDNLINSHATT